MCPDKRLPEENKGNTYLKYTDKVDAWACGVLAFELLVGYPPFGMSTREASVRAVLYEAPKVPQWLPPAAADFIKWALTKNPAHRPTVAQLLQHSWILAFKCGSTALDVLCVVVSVPACVVGAVWTYHSGHIAFRFAKLFS